MNCVWANCVYDVVNAKEVPASFIAIQIVRMMFCNRCASMAIVKMPKYHALTVNTMGHRLPNSISNVPNTHRKVKKILPSLIKRNIKNVPCLACTEINDPVLVFACDAGHVTCLDCFRTYCLSRLMERQFIPHPDYGYTLGCPAGCENSFINEVHHFKLLTREQYERYQRFATEEYVLQGGGVICPQPGCGMGLLVDPDCTKVTCFKGCGVSAINNNNMYIF